MKTLLNLLLIVAVALLPCAAQSITAPSSLPTASALGTGDVVVGVQGAQLVIISQAQMQAWAQGGCVLTSGSYANPSWLTSIPFSKLTSTPTTLSGYGITDPIVLTSGSYANPAWITSLAASKVTGLITYATVSGTNTYTATPSPALTSYTTGLAIYAKFTNANTAGSSLNLNSLGAIPIQLNGADIVAGTIQAGATLLLVYDGSHFQIVGLPGTAQPTATTSNLGLVQPDGTTTFVDGSGILSASPPITAQTGSLSGGTATMTVPAGCHPWVQCNASTPHAMSVTVSGTTATITGTGTDAFTIFNQGTN